ncbi:hypothetical protein M011DRAFT_389330, partial [Sporormia fimetaria CBS 119925]
RRKLKCDGNVPACTKCRDAGVECLGFNSSAQCEAPRSIADFLEAHLETLKSASRPDSEEVTVTTSPQPGSNEQSPTTGSTESSSSSFGQSRESTTASIEHESGIDTGLLDHLMGDITPSFLGITEGRPLLSCIVKGTSTSAGVGPVRTARMTDLDASHPNSILNPQPTTADLVLEGFDSKTAQGLLGIYIDCISPQYPIYQRGEIMAALKYVYNSGTCKNASDGFRERYIVSLVMAMALSSAAKVNQKKAKAHAYSLVCNAMRWIPIVATNDLGGLQALLLLAHYAFMNPGIANIWLLTGLTSQAVIDLGLHQELPDDANVSHRDRDTRRRLFWVAWEMEVSVCSVFSRPVALPLRHFEVFFPSGLDDVVLEVEPQDLPGTDSKFISKKFWLSRQIEAEIMSVLQQEDPIPAQYDTLAQWVHGTASSVQQWYVDLETAATANPSLVSDRGWKGLQHYADIARPYLLLMIYRPSKRIPRPTQDYWLRAFVTSVEVAEAYLKQAKAKDGCARYVFHGCHHGFTAAWIFLDALAQCRGPISERYYLPEVEAWMRVFTELFKTISERWTAASSCLEDYQRILESRRNEYLRFLEWK